MCDSSACSLSSACCSLSSVVCQLHVICTLHAGGVGQGTPQSAERFCLWLERLPAAGRHAEAEPVTSCAAADPARVVPESECELLGMTQHRLFHVVKLPTPSGQRAVAWVQARDWGGAWQPRSAWVPVDVPLMPY